MSDINELEQQLTNLSLRPQVKSPLKWSGGKGDIMNSVMRHIPADIDTYYEPFLGSGTVLLHVLQERDVKKCIVGDINPHIINLYINIRDRVDALVAELKTLQQEYTALPIQQGKTNSRNIKKPQDKAEYFYYSRDRFNSIAESDLCEPETSALFVFLNKTAFRGLYRENKAGKFNVPFGNYAKPNIIDEKNMRGISTLIKDVEFKISGFEKFISDMDADPKNFIYLDPPYFKETKTSFDSYTSHGFDIACHTKLYDLVKANKVRFLLSNSNTDFVKNAFKDFTINYVECKRRINSKKPNSKTIEVLIQNTASL